MSKKKNTPQTKTIVYANDPTKSSGSVIVSPTNKNDEPIGFKKTAPVSTTPKSTTTYGGSSGNYSGGSSYNSGNYNGSSSYNSGGGSKGTYKSGHSYQQIGSTQMEPTKAFEFNGIEFWGAAKSKLESFAFQEGDVIVNCTGNAIHVKPFIKSMPDWISQKEIPGGKPPEILFDWPDFKTPPLSFKLDFWKNLLESFDKEGIRRVLVCCMAGQGRTGTALAAFALATGAVRDHKHAISLIRSEYSAKAVESNDQEMYLEYLVANSGNFFFNDPEEEEEYYREFYDDFYGTTKEKIDLAQFVGSDIEDIIDWFEERDSQD